MTWRAIVLIVAAAALVASGAFAVPAAVFPMRPLWRRLSRYLGLAGTIGCGAVAAAVWQGLGRPPVAGASESMLLLAPALALGYLATEALSKSREGGLPVMLAAALAALAGLPTALAPLWPQELPPALASAWLVPYAAVTWLAYGLLGGASLQGLAFLVASRIRPGRTERAGRAVYWSACLGLPLLAGSLMLGAVWAQNSGGSYLTFTTLTARETWALAYCAALLAYLNLRYVGEWPERRAIWILVLGVLLWVPAFQHADEIPVGRGDSAISACLSPQAAYNPGLSSPVSGSGSARTESR